MKHHSLPSFRSVALQLNRRMLAGALLCTLIVLALEMAWVVHRERAAFDEQVQAVMQTHRPLLIDAVWDIEPAEVQRLLDGITAVPAIRCAVLEVATGQRFRSCGKGLSEPAGTSAEDILIHLPNPQASESSLGTLRIAFNQDYLYRQLGITAAQLAVALVVLTFVLTAVSQLIVRHELLDPMDQIARFAGLLGPGKLGAPMQLDRRGGARRHRDEIDVVGEGFKTLQTEVARYVEESTRQEARLAALAADLEQQVQHRTTELRTVGAYLESLSLNSSRFLGAAPDEFALLMRNTLRELSQFSEGSSLALAEKRGADGPLLWRHVWQSAVDSVSPLREGDALPEHLVMPLQLGWNHQRTQDLTLATREHAQALRSLDAQAVLCCAYQSGELSRYMVSFSSRPDTWKRINERLAQMSADMLFNAMQRHQDQMNLQQMHSELEHLSNTDALTGLANRRHFDAVKLKETRRALRTAAPLSVISIDIDHFKAYNDTYGHAGGDTCLAMVAQAIRATFSREGELPARVGGEEFVVLLPDQPLSDAFELAQRLRQRLYEQQVPHAGSPIKVVTISVGVACLERSPMNANLSAEEVFARVLEASDQALYEAKHAGRNRVRWAGQDSHPVDISD